MGNMLLNELSDFVFGVLRKVMTPYSNLPSEVYNRSKVRKDRPTSHLKLVTEVYPYS